MRKIVIQIGTNFRVEVTGKVFDVDAVGRMLTKHLVETTKEEITGDIYSKVYEVIVRLER